MKARELIGEISACATFLLLMIGLLVFGTVMMPQQQGINSEATYLERK